MQLVYRGSAYTRANSEVALAGAEITGKYRGAEVSFKSSLGLSEPQAVATLTYRGSSYLRVRR
jgi:hypothetical protein